MGTVIQFPHEQRLARTSAVMSSEGASVVILPVVRVERAGDETGGIAPDGMAPEAGRPSGGRRRRPGRRS
jgi:hypothetical protein